MNSAQNRKAFFLVGLMALVVLLPNSAQAVPSYFDISPWSGTEESDENSFPSLAAPRLPAGKWAYTGDLYTFHKNLEGEPITEGESGTVEDDDSINFVLFATGHQVRVAPSPSFEIALSYDILPSISYDFGSTSSVEFNLNRMEEYRATAKAFVEDKTFYMGFLEKRQWGEGVYNTSLPANTDHRIHYEHALAGLIWRPVGEFSSPMAFPSEMAPTLAPGEVEYGLQADYRNGKATRYTYVRTGSNGAIFHSLDPNFSFDTSARWGLDWLGSEIQVGLDYTLPVNYHALQRSSVIRSGVISMVRIDYEQDQVLGIPLKIRMRPTEEIAVMLGSDMKHTRQRAVYNSYNSAGLPINLTNPSNHNFFEWDPEIRLAYWGHQPGAGLVDMGNLAYIRPPMLRQNQYLIETGIRRSVTVRFDENERDDQNLLDPYYNFQYPFEHLFDNTEYAQNNELSSATRTLQTGPQNYWRTYGRLTYGVSDDINVNAGVGYQSPDGVSTYGLIGPRTVADQIAGFWFLTGGFEWLLSKQVSLEGTIHYVPLYQESTSRYTFTTGKEEYDETNESSYVMGTAKLKAVF